MTAMQDREEAFENKFAHDLELDFRVQVRASRQLGLWAAEKAGLADAENYAAEIVALGAGPGGQAAARRQVLAVLAGRDVNEHAVERAHEKFMAEARQDIMNA